MYVGQKLTYRSIGRPEVEMVMQSEKQTRVSWEHHGNRGNRKEQGGDLT